MLRHCGTGLCIERYNMVEKTEGIDAKLALTLKSLYNVTLIKDEKFETLNDNFAQKGVQKIVNDTPIEEVSSIVIIHSFCFYLFISESSIDLSMNKDKTQLDKPLFIEIKTIRNVSKPFQRVSKDQDWDDAEKAERKA